MLFCGRVTVNWLSHFGSGPFSIDRLTLFLVSAYRSASAETRFTLLIMLQMLSVVTEAQVKAFSVILDLPDKAIEEVEAKIDKLEVASFKEHSSKMSCWSKFPYLCYFP